METKGAGENRTNKSARVNWGSEMGVGLADFRPGSEPGFDQCTINLETIEYFKKEVVRCEKM